MKQLLYSLFILSMSLARMSMGAEESKLGILTYQIELPHNKVLPNEHQTFNLVIKNNTKKSIRIPKFNEGMLSGIIDIHLYDLKANAIPLTIHSDRIPPTEDHYHRLAPGKTETWSNIDTGNSGLDMSNPGQYRIRIGFTINDKRVTAAETITVLDPDNIKKHKTIKIPIQDVDWAGKNESVCVEAITIDEDIWIYYQRLNEHGIVLSKRMGKALTADSLEATGDAKQLSIRFTTTGKKLKTTLIDPQDGSIREAKK